MKMKKITLILAAILYSITLISQQQSNQNSQAEIYNEPFDYNPGDIPPGWEITGDSYLAWAVNNSSEAGGNSPELLLNWAPSDQGLCRLVTSEIETQGYNELRFTFKQKLNNYPINEGDMAGVDVSFDGGESWSVLWETEIIENIPATTSELYIDVPEGVNSIHLGFRFNGDSKNIDEWYIDDLYIENVEEENNLEALSIEGDIQPIAGMENVYSITIQNAGLQTQSDYNIKLFKDDDTEIASVAGELIEFAETQSYQLYWTPTAEDEGDATLYGYVDLENDELPENNTTSDLNIQVLPDDISEINIGEGSILDIQPWAFYWKNSLNQTLYYPDEIGIDGGLLTGIQFTNSFNDDWLDIPIKVWVGETDYDDLSEEWVDPASLQLVYDGNYDFPSGENDIYIEFDNSYVYTGGNLVVYTYKKAEENLLMENFFNSEEAGSNRTRRYATNDFIDPENPYHEGFPKDVYSNISLFFSTSGAGSLEGVVTDGTSPLNDVSVQVSGTNFSTVSDENGEYAFPYILAGTYNVNFSKYGYATGSEEITINEDETAILDVELEPFEQYTVTGKVTNSNGTEIEDANIIFEGYGQYEVSTDVNGDFSINNVYEGEYGLTVIADGYQVYEEDGINVFDDLDLGIIEIITTSNTNINNDYKISIYPNPSSEFVNLRSTSVIEKVQLTDFSGKLLYSAEVDSPEHKINIESISSGVYILQITDKEGIQIKKIQINK